MVLWAFHSVMLMTDTSSILFFVKTPQRGRVKSRLAASLGESAALELYQAFVRDLMDTLDRTELRTTIFVDAPGGIAAVSAWLGERRRYEVQTGQDLGARMEQAFRSAFRNGSRRAVLVGSDLPDLPGKMLVDAFADLKRSDAVIGPAADGGYYLIGFTKDGFRPEVFRDIHWSTPDVFGETMAVFGQEGSPAHVLPQWRDVDTIEDLRALVERSKGTAFERSRTMQTIRSLSLSSTPQW